MLKQETHSKKVFEHLEQRHSHILKNTDQLSGVLTNLQFEGKVAYGKNIRLLKEIMNFLHNELMIHIKLDDNVIFPFLQTHIPKLEGVIDLLISEHKEYLAGFKTFENKYAELLKEKDYLKRAKVIDQLRDKGIYLSCLLRNHIQAENKALYKVVDTDLKTEEREELLRRVEQYHKDKL